MNTTVTVIDGVRCIIIEPGAPIRDGAAGRDLLEAAMNEGARVIAVPVAGLDAAFFDLSTGLAGEIAGKLTTYHYTFAVVGDVSSYVAASKAFCDLVVESQRGGDFIFVPDLDALRARLASARFA
jgi:hypothetical protein